MNKKEFNIGSKMVGEGHPVLLYAEISANHLQDFERAKKVVKAACKAGVGAVKLQHYKPETLTLDSDKEYFKIKDHPLWKGKTLFDLYKQAYMPWEWYDKLKEITDNYKVPLFSTVCDATSVDFLEKRNCPAYKIGSFELGDHELLKKVAKTKKPIIMSRGMSTLTELEQSVNVLRENGACDIAVLHCVNAYPTENYEEMNLLTIVDIGKRFDAVVGLSEHTLTTSISVAGVALGAKIIERHFTLKRSDEGADAAFSLEPQEMANLVKYVKEVESALGKVSYGTGKEESKTTVFKRSLWVKQSIKKGEKFTRQNVGRFRPNYGLKVKHLSKILGKKAKKDIDFATPLTWNLVEK